MPTLAEVSAGVIKQRISRPGEGRSKGYRSILLFCKDEKAFFVYGFPKSNLANIRDDEESAFKKMARYVLALDDAQLNELIANGQFEEVEENGKEISQ